VDIQYAGADGSVTPTAGQTALVNKGIALGRTIDHLVMTVKGPVAPAGTTTMSYSYSDTSQVALSIAALRPAAAP
jgi:hypothetical protein